VIDMNYKFEDMDVIVMSDQAFLSRLIHFFVGKWSHCFIVTDAKDGTIVHADGGRVTRESLDSMLLRSPQYELVVLRTKRGVGFSNFKGRRWLNAQVGRKYDTLNAVARGLYRFLSWFGISRNSTSVFDDSNKYICSVLVGGMFDNQDIALRDKVDWTQLEPQDLLASDVLDTVSVIRQGESNA